MPRLSSSRSRLAPGVSSALVTVVVAAVTVAGVTPAVAAPRTPAPTPSATAAARPSPTPPTGKPAPTPAARPAPVAVAPGVPTVQSLRADSRPDGVALSWMLAAPTTAASGPTVTPKPAASSTADPTAPRADVPADDRPDTSAAAALLTVCRSAVAATADVTADSAALGTGCTRVGTAVAGAQRFTDRGAVPGVRYRYRLVDARGGIAAATTLAPSTTGRAASGVTRAAAVLGTGTVAGTVRAPSGAGVAGVTAYLLEVDNFLVGLTVKSTAVTASNGTYRLTGATGGINRSFVCFDASRAASAPVGGWISQCWNRARWSGDPTDLPDGAASVLSAGNGVAVTGIDTTLIAGAGLSGTVIAAAGSAPVAGATVYALTPGGESYSAPHAVTATNGTYTLSGLAPGAVRVCVDTSTVPAGSGAGVAGGCAGGAAWDGGAVSTAAKVTTLKVGTVTTKVNVGLAAGGAIAGRVTAATGGAGLGGVGVYVVSDHASPLETSDLASTGGGLRSPDTTTAADGTYRVAGLRAGRYRVCFDAGAARGGTSTTGYLSACSGGVPWDADGVPTGATVSTVAAGAVVTADAALGAGSALSGRVTIGGTAAPGVFVYVALGTNGNGVREVVTDSQGAWSVRGLPVATYRACSSNQRPDGSGSPTAEVCSALVTTTAKTLTKGVTIALGAGATVAGVVTAAGTPLAGVTVSVVGQQSGAYGTAVTDAQGRYAVTGLSIGTATVCFDAGTSAAASPTAAKAASECYQDVAWAGGDAPRPAGAGLVAFTAGQTTAVDADLAVTPRGAVSGTVRDTAGPLDGVSVVASAAGGTVARTTTASDGTYVLASLPVGGVTVCFEPYAATGGTSTTGYVPECYDDVTGGGPGRTVPTTGGAVTTGIDATLGAAGGIVGTVKGGDASTLAGSTLQVFTPSGSNPVAVTSTAPDGTFAVGGLDSGSYLVCAARGEGAALPGYLPRCYRTAVWPGGYGRPPASATAVTVTVGAAPTAANLTLPVAGAVTGTVTRAIGGPALGASVAAYDASGRIYGFAGVAADGSYRLTGLETGAYRVCVQGGYVATPDGGGVLSECLDDQPWSGDTQDAPPDTARSVAVTAGTTTTGADAVLASGSALAGTVVDATGGGGLSDATVIVFDADGDRLGRTRTASDGSWRATGLPAGSYAVCAIASYAGGGGSTTGYLDRCRGGAVFNGYSLPGGVTTVSTTVGTTTSGVAVAAPRGSAVRGTVTSGSTPLTGGYVVVFDATGSSSFGYLGPDGTYLVTGLEAAPVTVCANGSSVNGASLTGYLSRCYVDVAWNGFGSPVGAKAVTLTAGKTTSAINLSLPAAAAVTGVVTDRTGGAGLGGVSVRVYDESDSQVGSGTTDYGTGSYRVAGLAAGAVRVCFGGGDAAGGSDTGFLSQCWKNVPASEFGVPANATRVTLTLGKTVKSIGAALTRGGALRGTITDATTGAAVSNATLRIVFPDGSYRTSYQSSSDWVVKGLATGSYRVCVDAGSASSPSGGGYFSECYDGVRWNPQQFPPSTATAVNVTAGAASAPVAIALDPSAAIGGQVTAATGGPLGNVGVQVVDSAGTYVGTVRTDGAGRYTVGGLAAGSYRVCFDAGYAYGGSSSTGYLDQCWKNVAWDGAYTVPSTARSVAVTTGAVVTGITAKLANGAAIAGTLTDAQGNGLSGAYVYAVRAGTSGVEQSGYVSNGQFRVAGLAAGSWNICFYAGTATGGTSATGYASECYDDVPWFGNFPPPSGVTPITTALNATATISAALAAGSTVSGTVRDTAGSPLGGASVEVFDAATQAYVGYLTTGPDGSWSAGRLAAGSYDVCAYDGSSTPAAPNGYAARCYVDAVWNLDGPAADATAVPVAAGATAAGIDLALPPYPVV